MDICSGHSANWHKNVSVGQYFLAEDCGKLLKMEWESEIFAKLTYWVSADGAMFDSRQAGVTGDMPLRALPKVETDRAFQNGTQLFEGKRRVGGHVFGVNESALGGQPGSGRRRVPVVRKTCGTVQSSGSRESPHGAISRRSSEWCAGKFRCAAGKAQWRWVNHATMLH